jgi:hypothetical protein
MNTKFAGRGNSHFQCLQTDCRIKLDDSLAVGCECREQKELNPVAGFRKSLPAMLSGT